VIPVDLIGSVGPLIDENLIPCCLRLNSRVVKISGVAINPVDGAVLEMNKAALVHLLLQATHLLAEVVEYDIGES
jgi:hypothetical protein